MRAEFATGSEYLEVIVSEQYSFGELYALIERTREEGIQRDRTKIFADMTRIIGVPAEMERFRLGVRVAEILPPPYRTLVLAEAGKINKFGEDTAVNRGALMLSTADREYGLDWLISKYARMERRNI